MKNKYTFLTLLLASLLLAQSQSQAGPLSGGNPEGKRTETRTNPAARSTKGTIDVLKKKLNNYSSGAAAKVEGFNALIEARPDLVNKVEKTLKVIENLLENRAQDAKEKLAFALQLTEHASAMAALVRHQENSSQPGKKLIELGTQLVTKFPELAESGLNEPSAKLLTDLAREIANLTSDHLGNELQMKQIWDKYGARLESLKPENKGRTLDDLLACFFG